jgi:hypothetical protein
MKADSQLQQGGVRPPTSYAPVVGRTVPVISLRSVLPGPVRADDSYRFTGRDIEADIAEHPFELMAPSSPPFGKPAGLSRVLSVGLAEPRTLRCPIYDSSTISPLSLRNAIHPRLRRRIATMAG